MKTADVVRAEHTKKLLEDKEIFNIVDGITETLYTQVIKENKYHLHRKYPIDIAKKVAFCLRFLDYNVIEYKHGKLEVFIR